MLEKIVSGGQTGVDRAALDAALALDFACGGWCPLGRKAEDGVIADKYPLEETVSSDYEIRTARNVEYSDGTIIFTRGKPTGGTALTVQFTDQYEKPCLVLDLKREEDKVISLLNEWILENRIKVLNVAGPRESKKPGIYREVFEIVKELIALNLL